ncbi:hypothetical protein F2Q70_00035734 [Brassica cretica]|uniref:Uncharacterized protein n=1 Tax=Brassica cretica TaxID=69181 RepID=A0A8S9JX20_BRACR|nr:hypothetical protein F2Q70_00035734 [Brassica cretica]
MPGGSGVAPEIAGASEDEVEHSQEEAASGLPLIPIPDSDDEGSPEGRRPPVPLSSGLQDNSAAASHKRRRSSKAVMQEPSRSK